MKVLQGPLDSHLLTNPDTAGQRAVSIAVNNLGHWYIVWALYPEPYEETVENWIQSHRRGSASRRISPLRLISIGGWQHSQNMAALYLDLDARNALVDIGREDKVNEHGMGDCRDCSETICETGG